MVRSLKALFLGLALLASIPAYGAEIDRVVAVVNDEVITWIELYRAMGAEMGLRLKGPVDDAQRQRLFKENESAFLEEMIDLRLELDEAKELGVYAGEREVDEALKNIMAANSMDEGAFVRALKSEGLTLEGFRKRVRDDITISKLVDREVRSGIVITDDEVKAYLESAGPADSEEARYRVRQILMAKPEGAPLDEKASLVAQELKSGTDFGELAARYSDDPQAGSTGGDLGFIGWGELAPEFQEALKGMEPGDISAPFKTGLGTHIIKLEEIKESPPKEDAREKLYGEKFSEGYRAWLRRLRGKSFVEIKL